ncbi:MAG: Sec-independent protein translocase protein TatB [Terriglobales bacterium]
MHPSRPQAVRSATRGARYDDLRSLEMSFGELLFLAMIALLVFGPRKLPEMARALAKIMAELRKASNEFRYSLEEEIRSVEVKEQDQKRLQAASLESGEGSSESEPRHAAVEGSVARES